MLNEHSHRSVIIRGLFIWLLCAMSAVSQHKTQTTIDGYQLELFKSKIFHYGAVESCQNRNGWLVRIKDENMRKAVENLKSGVGGSKGGSSYYIGLQRIDDQWIWNDETKLTEDQARWKSGEGNDSGQNCACIFNKRNTWLDSGCEEFRRHICQIEFLTITPEATEIIAIEGENVTVSLHLTRKEEVEIDIEVYKDSEKSDTILMVDENPLYIIENIGKDDAAIYRFVAKPKGKAFNRSADVNITVHVAVSIENWSSTFIYSPVSSGAESVNCTAYGIPTPKTNWQRYGVLVTTEKGGGVHQGKTNDAQSVLFIGDALLSDQGNYTCHATNCIGELQTKQIMQKDISLSVYGAPSIVEQSVEKCSFDGKVMITWKPNNQTIGINHRVTVQQPDSVDDVVSKEMLSDLVQTTTFDDLKSFTNYTINITVCPDGCISQLKSSVYVTTGIRLPNVVSNTSVQFNNTYCLVKWGWSDIIPLKETDFEITETSAFVYVPPNSEPTSNIIYETDGKPFSYEIKIKPNRMYSFSVAAKTCAGSSERKQAVGECVTDSAAPDNVVSPDIINEDSNTKKQEIQIAIPDETNGQIVCIFVLMKSGENTSNSAEFTQDQLEKAEEAATTDRSTEGVEYIAMAITRSNIDGTKTTVALGDGGNSECNTADNTSKQTRRYIRSSDTGSYRGKNWPLISEMTYSYYIVTSTPTNTRGIQFGKSAPTTFEHIYVEERSNNFVWVAGPVVGILVALVLIAVLIYRKRSQEPKNKDKNDAPTVSQSPLEAFVYENLRATGNDSKINRLPTSIPIEGLKNYYEEMNAENGKKFLEEFTKLKLQAVTTFSTNDALQDFTTKKNRYKNILPYDATRVVLRGDSKESYINASYIHGYNKAKKFIATQGPLSTTVDDFWQMIVEQRSRIIVMLTKCTEAGKNKCEQYWPDLKETKRYEAITVTCDGEMDYGGYTKRTFSITGDGSEPYTVEQYHFMNWPDHGILLTTSSFFRFYMVCMESYSDGEWPIIVHCSAGAGRTGAFIGFDYLLEENLETQHVDIYECVLKMRQQRIQMVQTCDQYKLLHKCLLEANLFGNTDSDHTEIKEKIHENRKKLIQEEFTNIAVAASISKIKELQNEAYNVVIRWIESDEGTIPRINAHKIETYDDKIRMIAAEGPTVSTVEYFWRAILDNDVTLLVMLNKVGRKSESLQYWPLREGQCGIFGKISVQLVSSRPSRHFIERHFSIACGSLQKAITQYQLLGWRSDICPEDPSGVLDVINRVRTYSTNTPNASIIVHCNNGIGRTGAFCAMFNIVERLKIEERADIFRAVKDLQDCRPGMVQNLDQYTFCYRAADLWLDSDHGYAQADRVIENPYENVRQQNERQMQYENMPVRV